MLQLTVWKWCRKAVNSSGAERLINHYTSVITQRAADILKYTTVIAADGCFMKEGFITALSSAGLRVITKARQDANMRYLYKGVQGKGRGRKKKYDGKPDCKGIDRRFRM